jgi:hypothetical protein
VLLSFDTIFQIEQWSRAPMRRTHSRQYFGTVFIPLTPILAVMLMYALANGVPPSIVIGIACALYAGYAGWSGAADVGAFDRGSPATMQSSTADQHPLWDRWLDG